MLSNWTGLNFCRLEKSCMWVIVLQNTGCIVGVMSGNHEQCILYNKK